MLAHAVNDAGGDASPLPRLALGSNEERIHEGLRVVPPDGHQQRMDQPPHHRLPVVDARYDLNEQIEWAVSPGCGAFDPWHALSL